jgi:hypothetical protein
VIIKAGIIFFFWVHGDLVEWEYAGPILIGIVVTLIVSENLLLLQSRKKRAV